MTHHDTHLRHNLLNILSAFQQTKRQYIDIDDASSLSLSQLLYAFQLQGFFCFNQTVTDYRVYDACLVELLFKDYLRTQNKQ